MQNIQRAIQAEIEKLVQTTQASQYRQLREDIRISKKMLFELKNQMRMLEKKFLAIQSSRPQIPPKRYRITGESVYRLRKRLGLTETELSIILNVALETVSRWEHGKLRLKKSTQKKIIELRGIGKRAVRKLLEEKRAQQSISLQLKP
mgnify:CR=1 FL=1